MKKRKILSFIMAVIITITVVLPVGAAAAAAQTTPAFSDIQGHWAEKTITEYYEKGMLKGYPDGTFKPDQEMTRAELITLLNRYFGLTGATEDIFRMCRIPRGTRRKPQKQDITAILKP